MEESLAELENRLGIVFNDKSLLRRALIHSSYLNEKQSALHEDNERLEYLGDAVLGFIVAETLYHHYPELQEGDLTNMRAALVRESALAGFAAKYNLGEYLFIGSGEAANGGRQRHPILCAAFEALVAAIYLDQGLTRTRSFILNLVDPELEHARRVALSKDAKSRLQEWVQGHWHYTPIYRTVSAIGPDHAKIFTVEAIINEKVYGVGEGHSKQSASQVAAHAALNNILAAQKQKGDSA